jgi:hypothetical protein
MNVALRALYFCTLLGRRRAPERDNLERKIYSYYNIMIIAPLLHSSGQEEGPGERQSRKKNIFLS